MVMLSGIINLLNNKIIKMKNIKYIIAFLSLVLVFSACEEENYEFGDLTAPSNLQMDFDIVGSDVNPLGDGTGVVNFDLSANNALSYRIIYNGQESNIPTGKTSIAFNSEEGTAGPNGGQLFNVTAVAYGVGGTSSSMVKEIEVIGFVQPPLLLEDFEGDVPDFITFGPDDHPIAVIDNLFISGINESNKVVEYAKPSGSEGWAGINVPVSGIDLDTYSKFSIKVYATKANVDMVLKVETPAGDTDPKWEMTGRIDKSDEWIEVFFDFSDAPVGGYTNVILFFDTWNSGDDSKYYFDDIKLSK